MLRQQDVGHRVVVRRIVGIREGRPLFSDALGELVELSETHITIATDRGRLQVPRAEVHRAKRVPPAHRPTAAGVVALERAADEAWPAPVRDRLGDWLLRAADGWTGRANSALPVGDPDRPLPAALDAVERWYADRGQPALINTPLPLAAPVGAELDARGWGARPLVLVQTVRLSKLLATPPPPRPDPPTAPPPGADPTATPAAGADPATALPPPSGPGTAAPPAAGAGATAGASIELSTVPSPEWLSLAAGRKGSLPDAARHVLTAVDQLRFAHAYADGALVAIGRGTITGQGRWLGVTLIEVVPSARRQGWGRAVVQALAGWAAADGATDAFLQVEQRNTAAVGLYQSLGFSTHHTYLTRVPPT